MNKGDGFFIGIGITYVTIIVLGIAGWITNIINVVGFIGTEMITWTGYQVLEIVGIFVPPLGGILGIISWF